jgi:hypothetical protein
VLALAVDGAPQVLGLLLKLLRHEFGSDLLAGISIVASVMLRGYLAGALQSAVGGMALSFLGMLRATERYLPPAPGAIMQEIIDVLAVVNALRAAIPPKALADYSGAS